MPYGKLWLVQALCPDEPLGVYNFKPHPEGWALRCPEIRTDLVPSGPWRVLGGVRIHELLIGQGKRDFSLGV